MRPRNSLWQAPDHRIGASPTHVEEPQTFTSSSSPTRGRRSPLRHRLTILASAAALSIAGLLALTGPAYADAVVEITGPTDPVTVNTPYDYTVNVPSYFGYFHTIVVSLTGAPATFTSYSSSGNPTSCTLSGTQATCNPDANTGAPIVLTLTVLPTSTGTVTANVTFDTTGPPPAADGSDSTTTTITESTPTGCTITGTAGNDTLNGTNGDDVICGLGGNDTINGGNGSDTLYGGSGNDIMGGGNGADTLYGEAGDDTNYGETLVGSLLYLFDNGNDHIEGGPGNDDLDGQNGNDALSDPDSSDTDTMSGNVGTDTINVEDGAGGDTANGGLGNDTCTIDAGDTTISC